MGGVSVQEERRDKHEGGGGEGRGMRGNRGTWKERKKEERRHKEEEDGGEEEGRRWEDWGSDRGERRREGGRGRERREGVTETRWGGERRKGG